VKRIIFGFAIGILAIAGLFFWYANRTLISNKPLTILHPGDVSESAVSAATRSPFELNKSRDLYLFGRDILLDSIRLQAMLPFPKLTGFVSAIASEYRSRESSAIISAALIQFESWQSCLSTIAEVKVQIDSEVPTAFVTSFGELVLFPPYLMVLSKNSDYTERIAQEVSKNLDIPVWKSQEFFWLIRVKTSVPTPFQFAESPSLDGLLVEFLSGKKLHIVLRQEFADNIEKQMPVRPFGIATAAVDRLFSRKIEDTVYLRAEGRLVFLLSGYGRNPSFPERLEILNTLSYP